MTRAYLDWNASAPLRPEARDAITQALALAGNPSSVHSEGRAARALIEAARHDLIEALGAHQCDLIFTSGATEAAALAMAGRDLQVAGVEHDAVLAWGQATLWVDTEGRVAVADPAQTALQLANSETGVIQNLTQGLAVSDLTQGFGKIPFAFDWLGVEMGFISAHKVGGPKGVGALVVPKGYDLHARIRGGGQEMGRRSGTENVAGIAGFAAAAKAAQAGLTAGAWDEVARKRDLMEDAIASQAKTIIYAGKGASRLPNTSCMIAPGWPGETQVMAMDLAGFAISAGSACASGKAKAGGALPAMGFDRDLARCAIRVSIGPETTEADILRFADIWATKYEKRRGSVPLKENA